MILKSIKRITDLDAADFIVKWRLTDMCNANCSYCIRKSFHQDVEKEKLETIQKQLCDIAKELSRLINSTQFSKVKIDLIGGEVTLFDLKAILKNIDSDKITRINITSNIIKDVNYFDELCEYLHSRNIKLTLTASYHFEYISFEKYFEKVEHLKKTVDFLCCEIVSLEDNQDLCKKFVEKCTELNLLYRCEVDIRFGKENVRKLNLISDSNKKESARYKVLFTDGTEQMYTTRNQLLIDRSIEENINQKIFRTQGMMCSKNYDFIYVDFDQVGGRTETVNTCLNRTPIKDFKLIQPRPCIARGCTLCGHMNLWRE